MASKLARVYLLDPVYRDDVVAVECSGRQLHFPQGDGSTAECKFGWRSTATGRPWAPGLAGLPCTRWRMRGCRLRCEGWQWRSPAPAPHCRAERQSQPAPTAETDAL